MKKTIYILAIFILLIGLVACNNKTSDWKISMENFFTQFNANDGGENIPCKYRFHDLDGDNIPEIIISFGPPEGELRYEKVYKLYGDSYEQIGSDVLLRFFTNQEGKLVAEKRSGYMVDGVYFAEIKDKKLVFNDYIDSNGNDNYNGVKYNNLQELHQNMDIFAATDLDNVLKIIPEMDCNDIVNAAKNKIYKWDNGWIANYK